MDNVVRTTVQKLETMFAEGRKMLGGSVAWVFTDGEPMVMDAGAEHLFTPGFRRDCGLTVLTNAATVDAMLAGELDPKSSKPGQLFVWGGEERAAPIAVSMPALGHRMRQSGRLLRDRSFLGRPMKRGHSPQQQQARRADDKRVFSRAKGSTMAGVNLSGFHAAVADVVAIESRMTRLSGRLAERAPALGEFSDYLTLQLQVEAEAKAISDAATTFAKTDKSLKPAAEQLRSAADTLLAAKGNLTGRERHGLASADLAAAHQPMASAIRAALGYCQAHTKS